MTDSENTDPLAAKHERNRRERLDEIERWVEYIQHNPPEVWGEQLNTLIESQLEAAQQSGLSAEHYDRIERTGRELAADEATAENDDA